MVREGEEIYAATPSVRRSSTPYCPADSGLFTAAHLLAGPIAPHYSVRNRGQERSAGSARLGRFWQASGLAGRGREYGARIRRVRTEAHGQLPCLRHYATG